MMYARHCRPKRVYALQRSNWRAFALNILKSSSYSLNVARIGGVKKVTARTARSSRLVT